jgi:hypothetical protein
LTFKKVGENGKQRSTKETEEKGIPKGLKTVLVNLQDAIYDMMMLKKKLR